MNYLNQTVITYFITEGISNIPALQAPIFLLVLFLYLFTLGGNLTILVLVCLDHNLHTPMYFFLINLSIIDISSTSDTLPILLGSLISGNRTISFLGCMIQYYLFISLMGVQIFVLVVMSFDRYVAICKPLLYTLIMNQKVCLLLAGVCWVWGFLQYLPHFVILAAFTCYRSRHINHYFCDIFPLLKITCGDTSYLDTARFAIMIFFATFATLLIIMPYMFIIDTILRIRSSVGRRKAFYTCSSYLTLLGLLYMTLACQYLGPNSKDNFESNKLFSLLNTAALPMLNPLIYSLKNRDVKSALRRQLKKFVILWF